MSNKNDKVKSIQFGGIAVFPKLNAPYRFDQATKRSVVDWNEGKFSVRVAVPAAEAQDIIEKIKAAAAAGGVKKLKNEPWADETDKAGNDTGRVVFVCKAYATRLDGSRNRIAQFDRTGGLLDEDFALTGGSTIKVDVYPKAFTNLGGGVSLLLNAVQVVKLVERQIHNPFGDAVVPDEDDKFDANVEDASAGDNNDENASTDF